MASPAARIRRSLTAHLRAADSTRSTRADGIAALLGFTVRGFGDVLRFFQTGNVRNYALMFFIGVIVFIEFFG